MTWGGRPKNTGLGAWLGLGQGVVWWGEGGRHAGAAKSCLSGRQDWTAARQGSPNLGFVPCRAASFAVVAWCPEASRDMRRHSTTGMERQPASLPGSLLASKLLLRMAGLRPARDAVALHSGRHSSAGWQQHNQGGRGSRQSQHTAVRLSCTGPWRCDAVSLQKVALAFVIVVAQDWTAAITDGEEASCVRVFFSNGKPPCLCRRDGSQPGRSLERAAEDACAACKVHN